MNSGPIDSNCSEDLAGAHAPIQSLFEAQARRTPSAIAVKCGAEALTYRQLNERANQVAHYLQKCQVGPDVPVALCLERSLEMVVAILGVLKSGAAYLPLDPVYPRERLGFILGDAQAPVLLTQQSLLGSLPAHGANVISLDADWEKMALESTENPASAVTGSNTAYVIYTSGSTGAPKGVLVSHWNVARLFAATRPWFDFNSSDVWTLFHSYAFDFSVWEIWGALLHGGRLVVVPYLVSRSPSAFCELLGREQVTVLNQTPSAFRQLIWAEASLTVKQSLALRCVIFGGEALELQSLRPWFERHGDEKPLLVNMYGITETTVHVTYRPIKMRDLAAGLGSVIGVPIPDLHIYLLDEAMGQVGPCLPGEIYVGGAGVARGYLNRPELTRERFIADPFSSEPGARLYRSGDLAQRLPNGELEYLGRADQQIKIHGFRIELGEIETVLNQHPAVRESVIVAHPGADGDKRLVAYLVPKNSSALPPKVPELREHLGRKLPAYMMPAAFVILDSLPLTPNGKVDRRALPLPDGARPALNEGFVAARSRAERILEEIWSGVLEVAPVGVNDNFFELGGDSIRAIALLSRARQRGLSFTLQQLFIHPTIAGLAGCLGEEKEAKPAFVSSAPFSLISEGDRAKLPPDIEDAYPMIELQTGMFYYNELNPASAVYHDVFSFQIQASFDRGCLDRALRALLQRHPIFRTSFHLGEFSEPMQLVHKEAPLALTLEDLSNLAAAEQDGALDRFIDSEKRAPFDRAVAPLVRFHVQVQSAGSFQFVVSFHHVCMDGWSLAELVREVLEDYTALLGGAAELGPRRAWPIAILWPWNGNPLPPKTPAIFGRGNCTVRPRSCPAGPGKCARAASNRCGGRKSPSARPLSRDCVGWLARRACRSNRFSWPSTSSSWAFFKVSPRWSAGWSAMAGPRSWMATKSWGFSSTPCPCASRSGAARGSTLSKQPLESNKRLFPIVAFPWPKFKSSTAASPCLNRLSILFIFTFTSTCTAQKPWAFWKAIILRPTTWAP